MKILKSKLLVAMMLGGLMSGMSSFSTTSISAQNTSSGTTDSHRNNSDSGVGTVHRMVFVEAIRPSQLYPGPIIESNRYQSNVLD